MPPSVPPKIGANFLAILALGASPMLLALDVECEDLAMADRVDQSTGVFIGKLAGANLSTDGAGQVRIVKLRQWKGAEALYANILSNPRWPVRLEPETYYLFIVQDGETDGEYWRRPCVGLIDKVEFAGEMLAALGDPVWSANAEPRVWPVQKIVATEKYLANNGFLIFMSEGLGGCAAGITVDIFGYPKVFDDKPLTNISLTSKNGGDITTRFDLDGGSQSKLQFCATRHQLDNSEIEFLYNSRAGRTSLIIDKFVPIEGE